jgi:hypothetical protein
MSSVSEHLRRSRNLKFLPLKLKQVFKWRRDAYLLLVKFRPDETPRDFVDFFDRVDEKLYKKYGKTRHEMGIHERATYKLKGDYQLAVLWDAPNRNVAKKFLAVWLKRDGSMHTSDGSGFKGSNNLVSASGKY